MLLVHLFILYALVSFFLSWMGYGFDCEIPWTFRLFFFFHVMSKLSLTTLFPVFFFFFFFFSFHWGMNETKKYQLSILIILISNHFHAKLKRKQLWNKAKFKLIRKSKNKLTNGHGGMIIQLRADIFERIQNVQIQALEPVFLFSFFFFFFFLSLPFLCVFHLWIKRYRRHFAYNDVMRDSVTCSLTLCYWKSLCKMPSALFPLEHFSFI